MRLKELQRGRRGPTPPNIWTGSPQAGPGAGDPEHKAAARPSGPPSAASHPSHRGLNFDSSRKNGEGTGGPEPRVRALEEAGLAAQSQARRRRRNAGPGAGFRAPLLLPPFLPRRPADPADERPAARPRRRPVTAPRPRRDILPPPARSDVFPAPSAFRRAQAPNPQLCQATWIRFLCRLRSAMLATPPGSF